MTGEVIASLVASAIFGIGGYVFGRLRERRLGRAYRRAWGAFRKSGSVSVVLSTRPGPHPRSTPRVSLSEMRAYVEIQKAVDLQAVSAKAISSDVPLDSLRDEDLLLLGGPLANRVTAAAWGLISDRSPFVLDHEKQLIFQGDTIYEPILDVSGKLERDFGILARLPSALNPERTMVVAAGCHGFATYGAAHLFSSRSGCQELARKVDSNPFVALVQMDIREGALADARIIRCFQLTD